MIEAIRHIGKLKASYDRKIADCDKLIDSKQNVIRRIRYKQSTESTAQVSITRKELSIINAQRQAYVQAKADIDSIIDFVDID